MYYLLYGIGKREKNEDAYKIIENDYVKIYLVADGCGGYTSGDIASQKTVDFLGNYFNNNPCNEEAIKLAITKCNELIIEEQSNYGAMKTTIVGLVRTVSSAYAFNVGDSRLFQVRNGHVIFNTEDHAIPYVLYKAGIIEKSEINNHEDRNKILEALGAKSTLKINVYQLDIHEEDYVFLATDGCWEHIYDADFLNCRTGKENEWLEYVQNKIISSGKEDQDNYTGLLIGAFR